MKQDEDEMGVSLYKKVDQTEKPLETQLTKCQVK